MKDAQVRQCIDYIRFSMELEGSSLEGEDERRLTSLLEGDADADEMIAAFIRDEGLDVPYEAADDEMSSYPGTKCLVNYFNIREKERLRQIEHFMVNVRTCQLFVHPLPGMPTFSHLVDIHSHLFGDIYPSAGMIRTTDASKRKEFCRPQFIESYSRELFAKLSNDSYLRKIDNVGDMANDLAFYMGEAEALHPFKDGNGRAVRFFFNSLAWDAGFHLHWEDAEADRMLEASIAAIDGDYQALVDVLEEILEVRS